MEPQHSSIVKLYFQVLLGLDLNGTTDVMVMIHENKKGFRSMSSQYGTKTLMISNVYKVSLLGLHIPVCMIIANNVITIDRTCMHDEKRKWLIFYLFAVHFDSKSHLFCHSI